MVNILIHANILNFSHDFWNISGRYCCLKLGRLPLGKVLNVPDSGIFFDLTNSKTNEKTLDKTFKILSDLAFADEQPYLDKC